MIVMTSALETHTLAAEGTAGRFVRLAFYVFVMSLVFESPDRPLPIELHTLTGSLLLGAAILQPRHCWAPRPLAFWLFALFAWIYVVFGVRTEHVAEMAANVFRLAQLVLLFLVSYNLLRHAPTARAALVAFVLACATLGVLQRAGVTSTATMVSGTVRVSALGQNPNMLAHHMALGATAALGLAMTAPVTTRLASLGAWLIALPIAGLLVSTLVYTASRSGLMAATAGALVLGAFNGRRAGVMQGAAVTIAGAVLISIGVWRVPAMAERLDVALTTFDLSLRQDLFPASWDMFLQKPVAGWGPVNHMYELESRVPRVELPYRETHNVVLEVLTETGLVGAIPFVVAMGLCVLGGWRGRLGALGGLPLAMAAVVVVHRMSTAGIYTKAHWLALALALAAGAAAPPLRR